MRILIVEDDKSLVELVKHGFTEAGYAADAVHSLEDARMSTAIVKYDLLVIDIQLPDGNGLELIRELRRGGATVPMLVMTGRTKEEDLVLALDAGADDYVSKPVSNTVLLARTRALLRRHTGTSEDTLKVGALVINHRKRQVLLNTKPLQLTAREYALLYELASHAGEVVTRSHLLEKVWDMTFDPGSNVVDVHVANLRNKLNRAANHNESVVQNMPQITTTRGVGYSLAVS